jgi:hypothetical protein
VERTHPGVVVTSGLKPYAALPTAFLSRRLTSAEFQDVYIHLFKTDPFSRPREIREMLNDVFLAAEGLTSEDNPDYPYAVAEGELREVAKESLRRLNSAVESG